MLNSYKKLFVVLAVLVAPLMFVAACDDSAPPRPMDNTPAPPDPDPPSDDTSLGNPIEILFPGAAASFASLADEDEAALAPIVAGTEITVETLAAFDSELSDAILDLDASGLGALFDNIQMVADDDTSAITEEVTMIQEVINGGLNDLLVFGEDDEDFDFIGTGAANNDDVVALIDSLEITNEPGSSSVESISFTAPCDVTAISLPEDVLAPADDGATVEVAIEGNTISPADGQYTLELADAGMMITITATVTAEDGETTEDFTLTVETPTVAACS
jgi:hypothetical protein